MHVVTLAAVVFADAMVQRALLPQYIIDLVCRDDSLNPGGLPCDDKSVVDHASTWSARVSAAGTSVSLPQGTPLIDRVREHLQAVDGLEVDRPLEEGACGSIASSSILSATPLCVPLHGDHRLPWGHKLLHRLRGPEGRGARADGHQPHAGHARRRE